MLERFNKIEDSKNWIQIEPLLKGWSKDQKYIITDNKNKKYLLRISSIDLYNKKLQQFNLLKMVEKLNINASKPIAFGKLNDQEIYMLLTYLDGEDAETYVSKISDEEAYELGISAGKILKKLHSLPIVNNEKSWNEKYQEKMVRKISVARDCKYEIKQLDLLINYVEEHLDLVKERPQLFAHGDFHLGNLIVHNNKIGVIDFDKNGIADPYDEFKPFCWNVFVSEYFETGLINGYFDNNVPSEFFKVLALYAAEQLISHLPWAIQFGEEEIKTAYKVMDAVLDWYDNFKLIIPKWYKENIVQKHYDLLVEEGNDPVNDTPILREYMNKWDGDKFIKSLKLNKQKSVLEIGVGTGRLATVVAPYVKKFTGIDISSKSIQKAKEHIKEKVNLISDDFMFHDFSEKFDVIYSSLTFMHFNNKEKVLNKIKNILNDDGILVVSITKNQDKYIDYISRKIEVYPCTNLEFVNFVNKVNLKIIDQFETEYAYIFVINK